jgi:hypothetical protein
LLPAACLALSGIASADTSDDPAPASDEVATPDADAELAVRAWCVGGPLRPSYAFHNYNAAQNCYSRVASQSNDCRRLARIGQCYVNWYGSIGAYSPFSCQCAPHLAPIGHW